MSKDPDKPRPRPTDEDGVDFQQVIEDDRRLRELFPERFLHQPNPKDNDGRDREDSETPPPPRQSPRARLINIAENDAAIESMLRSSPLEQFVDYLDISIGENMPCQISENGRTREIRGKELLITYLGALARLETEKASRCSDEGLKRKHEQKAREYEQLRNGTDEDLIAFCTEEADALSALARKSRDQRVKDSFHRQSLNWRNFISQLTEPEEESRQFEEMPHET